MDLDKLLEWNAKRGQGGACLMQLAVGRTTGSTMNRSIDIPASLSHYLELYPFLIKL